MSDNSRVALARAEDGDRSELASLLLLAVPIVAANSGGQLMGFVDTAMVGRLGPAALGGVGIGNALFFSMAVIGLGSVQGIDPLVAQAIGAGEHERARRILWQGVRVALWMCIPVMALITLVALNLERAGIDAETAHEARRFMLGRLPNIIPFLVFSAARSYLQAAGGARVVVIAMVAANIANVVGNVLLIFGDSGLARLGLPALGLPALGVLGSALSSSIASLFSLLIAALGVRAIAVPDDPGRRAPDPVLRRKIIKLGAPISGQLLTEVGAFTIASVLAGRIGKDAAAAYQVAIMLASCTFTIMLGLSQATSVRVGQAVGRGDTPGARRAGFLALRVCMVFMSLTACVFIATPSTFAKILTDQADVIAAAAPLIQIAGFFQLSDGAQVVAAGALRGAGDTKSAQIANILGHYIIGLPIAIGLAFGLGFGAPGLWWGLSAGLTAAALALNVRFYRLSKTKLERV